MNANGDVIQDRTQKWSWSLSSCGRGPRGTVVRSEMRSRNFSKETDPDRSRSLGPRSSPRLRSHATRSSCESLTGVLVSGVRCGGVRYISSTSSRAHIVSPSPLLRVHIHIRYGVVQARVGQIVLNCDVFNPRRCLKTTFRRRATFKINICVTPPLAKQMAMRSMCCHAIAVLTRPRDAIIMATWTVQKA